MAEANPTRPGRTRKSTGSIVAPTGQRRSWSIRFRVGGKRYTQALGRPEEGWNRTRAEATLADVLAEIRIGAWQPPSAPATPETSEPQTFHVFASTWLAEREPELGERTRVDYRWRLSTHLLPYFAEHRLEQITVEEVNRYRRAKVREAAEVTAERIRLDGVKHKDRGPLPRPLSNGSINKCIRLLASILEDALDADLIEKNPASGRKRLLRESKPLRSYLQPEQVTALLDAAGTLDIAAREGDTGRRRPLLAILVLAGLRISEALELRWREVNLGAGRLRITRSKTDTGVRDVDLSPLLREVLAEYRTRTPLADPDDLVFPTATGRPDGASNVRRRFLGPAVKKANVVLSEAGGEQMVGVTPHSLRRTFISLLLATGADVPYVMAQVGHADPKMTLGVYAKVIASKTDHGAALDGLLGATTEVDIVETRSPSATR